MVVTFLDWVFVETLFTSCDLLRGWFLTVSTKTSGRVDSPNINAEGFQQSRIGKDGTRYVLDFKRTVCLQRGKFDLENHDGDDIHHSVFPLVNY